MSKSLEDEMVKALEGKFFWEQTTKYEDVNTGMTAEIRRVQRKFNKKLPPLYKGDALKEETQKKIKERLEGQKRLPDDVRKVKNAILKYYNITEDKFEGTGKMSLFPARAHYVWAVLRYNPHISLAGFGKAIGKHHSTVIHNRDLFERSKHLFEENIKAVDEILKEE